MEVIYSAGYPIHFEQSLEALGSFIFSNNYSKIFFLADRNTAEYCLPLVIEAIPELENYDIIEVDPGEENKNIDFCIGIWKMLLDFNADRKSLLINLGGGVVTDMGGFAAATYMRGIDFVQVPTTLLAQVDASVGGKTGIDLDGVKNIIGTFSLPKAVFIEERFLQSLDRRQLVSGFAEMIKHGLIADRGYYQYLKVDGPAEINITEIYRSMQLKNEVVTEDPKEAGKRKMLNFGHTIGHAIETYFMETGNGILHGDAIGMGMICESYLSNKLNGLPDDELKDISQFLLTWYGKYQLDSESFDRLLELMQKDKKNTSGQIGFALLTRIGECTWDHYVSEDDIRDSLAYYQQLTQEN